MSAEENKVILHRLIEEFNKGNLAAADESLAASFVDHSDPPGMPPGLEGHKQVLSMLLSAFPDLHVQVEDLLAEGDKVASRFTMRATHKGNFMGIPPTGKQVTITGIEIVRAEGGKFVERWANIDALGMLQQLGAIPAPGQSGV